MGAGRTSERQPTEDEEEAARAARMRSTRGGGTFFDMEKRMVEVAGGGLLLRWRRRAAGEELMAVDDRQRERVWSRAGSTQTRFIDECNITSTKKRRAQAEERLSGRRQKQRERARFAFFLSFLYSPRLTSSFFLSLLLLPASPRSTRETQASLGGLFCLRTTRSGLRKDWLAGPGASLDSGLVRRRHVRLAREFLLFPDCRLYDDELVAPESGALTRAPHQQS